jgi:anaphase-promoting complex subunit 3
MLADSQQANVQAESIPILPLQPHINGNLNGVVTPGHDPFNPKQRAMSIMYDSGILKETNIVPEWETPIGMSHEEDVTMDEAPFDSEAPHPPRKPRSLYTFPSEYPSDMAKLRSITTRSRTKAESDGQEESSSSRPTSIPVSHKRTVSGQAASSSEPPGAPNRRSDRLLRSRILPSSRIASMVGRDLDPKDRSGLRKVKATGTKGKTTSTVGRPVSGNRKPLEPTERDGKEQRPASVASIAGGIAPRKVASTPNTDVSPQKEALAFLIDQYSRLGKGYLALSRYDCSEAIASFESAVPQFRETPWTLCQVGRAHFERSAYAEAEAHFGKARKMSPSRTEDMEFYSTTLWHLRRDIDLAYLSHEMLEADRLSPQAWCALGNAFSVQGEHDRAVRCFRRATQLDSKFAYAFTLQGHEHVANEEYDKALLAFRSAISADARHYNGWYGLGQVFERLGRFEVAREHYAAAGRINPNNAVLKMCLGWVIEKTCEDPGTNAAGQPTILTHQEKLARRDLALECYEDAVILDPRSTKARSYKARVLMLLRRPAEAHAELKELEGMTPNNAQVHFLLGKVNRSLGDARAALKHFTIALSLDPKVCSPA